MQIPGGRSPMEPLSAGAASAAAWSGADASGAPLSVVPMSRAMSGLASGLASPAHRPLTQDFEAHCSPWRQEEPLGIEPCLHWPLVQTKLLQSPMPLQCWPFAAGLAEAHMPRWQMLSAQSELPVHGSLTPLLPPSSQPAAQTSTTMDSSVAAVRVAGAPNLFKE